MSAKRFAVVGNQAFALVNFRGRLITDLVARGVIVFALAPDFKDKDRDFFTSKGVRPVDYYLQRTGINPFQDVLYLFRLVRTLNSLKLDGIISITVKPAVYGTIAAMIAGIEKRYIMITGLGYAFNVIDNSMRRRVANLGLRGLLSRAFAAGDGVFLQNSDDLQDLVRLNILQAGKVVGVYPTGVDLAEWHALPAAQDPITFSLVGRMLRDKGVREFVAAARELKSVYPSVKFCLIGGVDSNPGAIGEAELLGWKQEGVVEWTGHVDVKPWLERTSVFVLPSSYREGVPRSTQEAMALGRAVVTTDVPGCRETVVDGRNGFLVQPNDAKSLRLAMQKFIDNPRLISDMGRESRKLAEERFDVAEINRGIITAMGL